MILGDIPLAEIPLADIDEPALPAAGGYRLRRGPSGGD
jgi:hypothetical protein